MVQLKYDSDYNAKEFKFNLKTVRMKLSIRFNNKKTHPEIKIDYLNVDENAPLDLVAKVKLKDPLNPSETIPLNFLAPTAILNLMERNNNNKKLDYETLTEHCFKIEATGSPKKICLTKDTLLALMNVSGN